MLVAAEHKGKQGPMFEILSGTSRRLMISMVLMLLMPLPAFPRGDLDLPELPAPEEYGDVVLGHSSAEKKVTPVVFSHWAHRPYYTCRVCHVELEISMKEGDTVIRCEDGDMNGRYCAACHAGRTAFGPTEHDGKQNCDRCHNANASPNREKFAELKGKLPAAKYGDGIDWTKALTQGLIRPKKSLTDTFKPLILDRSLSLEAEMSGIPPAVFPHNIHSEWLDCAMCHPDIFNIKKKTTKHFSMWRILNGEFCGVCHRRIAFPINDCRRCHPGMKH